MAAKKPFPFMGKESKKEEKAEKKVGAKAYMKGEKAEGEKFPAAKFPRSAKKVGK